MSVEKFLGEQLDLTNHMVVVLTTMISLVHPEFREELDRELKLWGNKSTLLIEALDKETKLLKELNNEMAKCNA